ncbi:MAG: signal peptidase II [Candidatus Marinimicrobia bacterium]|nr:signal peptidase II [Candidatus Neomarinimicrobiota bacterium]
MIKNHKRVTTLLIYIILIAIIFVADQFTKGWIRNNVEIGERIQIISNNVLITHVENDGIAFGMKFPGIQYLSYIAFFAVLWLLISHIRKEKQLISNYIAFSLIIAGAIGNLFDRFFHDSVTDMIMVGIKGYYWPIFNVADSAVTVGVIIFLVASYFDGRKEEITKE